MGKDIKVKIAASGLSGGNIVKKIVQCVDIVSIKPKKIEVKS